jgi:hypothetical protein
MTSIARFWISASNVSLMTLPAVWVGCRPRPRAGPHGRWRRPRPSRRRLAAQIEIEGFLHALAADAEAGVQQDGIAVGTVGVRSSWLTGRKLLVALGLDQLQLGQASAQGQQAAAGQAAHQERAAVEDPLPLVDLEEED